MASKELEPYHQWYKSTGGIENWSNVENRGYYLVNFRGCYMDPKLGVGVTQIGMTIGQKRVDLNPAGQGDNVMQAGGNLPDMKNNPPDHPEYESPKGGDRKVRNPNGSGKGWLDKKGRVWVPEDHNGSHAPHWDRQDPRGGTYTRIFPTVDPATVQKSLWITVGAGAVVIISEYWWVPLLAL